MERGRPRPQQRPTNQFASSMPTWPEHAPPVTFQWANATFGLMAPYLQQRTDGICISLKVQPRASRNEIAGLIGNELKMKVTAPPVDSAANEAVLEFLAETFGCARNQLELLRGATSRHKQILVRGLTAAQIEAKLR
jgi:uncharacterized protein